MSLQSFSPLFIPCWALEEVQVATGSGDVPGIEKVVVQDKLHPTIHPSIHPSIHPPSMVLLSEYSLSNCL